MFRDMVYIMSFSKLLNIDDFIFLKYLLSLDFGIHKKVPCNFFFVVVLFSLLFYFEKKNSTHFFMFACCGCVYKRACTKSEGWGCVHVNPQRLRYQKPPPVAFFTLFTVGGPSNETQSLQI